MYFCKVGNSFESPPIPCEAHVFQTLRVFRARVVLRIGHLDPWDTTEFVASYTGRKRKIYENAEHLYLRTGCQRQHATSVAFVKVEKSKPSGAPRCIQPRSSVYNIALGRYIKPVEHQAYRAIAQVFGSGPVVMKGFNVVEVAAHIKTKWERFPNAVAVGLDATKFDMHVSPQMLKWEHSIYRAVFHNYPELRKLLGWQMHNKGSGYCVDGKLRYSVKGKRFSGDMNTALGNCLIMCAMVWSYAQEIGVQVDLVNNGDDCVVFMDRKNLERFMKPLVQYFFRLGFRMVAEVPVYDLEAIEFCQMRPVFNGVEHIMVRNIRTALIKDCLSTIPLECESTTRKWLYAIGECGLALTAGVPIMQEFYMFFMREGNSTGNIVDAIQLQSGLRMMRGKLESKSREITTLARYSLFVAWGITPDEQVQLENRFKHATITHRNPSDISNFDPVADTLT